MGISFVIIELDFHRGAPDLYLALRKLTSYSPLSGYGKYCLHPREHWPEAGSALKNLKKAPDNNDLHSWTSNYRERKYKNNRKQKRIQENVILLYLELR